MKLIGLTVVILIAIAIPASAARLTLRAADGYTSVEEFPTVEACSARMCELWRLHACGETVTCDPVSNQTVTQLCPHKTLKPRSVLRTATCTNN